MKNRRCLVLFYAFVFPFWLQAQNPDTTLAWADRLLLQEIPFPVINRLDRRYQSQQRNQLPVINRLTDACLLSLEFSRSHTLLLRGDSLAPNSSRFEQAYLELSWARFLYERSDYPGSAAHGLSGLRLLSVPKMKPLSQNILHARIMIQLGKTYIQMKKMKEARPYLDAANDFLKTDSVLYLIPFAQVNFALGLWSKLSDQMVPAIGYYNHAINLFEESQTEHYLDLGKCFNNLATVYNELGNYGPAKLNYRKALEIKQKHVTDSLSLAITYNNLGKFYTDYGNNYMARDCYEKSIALLNENDPRHKERLPEFLNNYGSLLIETDEQEQAEKKLRRSLQILNSEGRVAARKLSPTLSLTGLLMIRGELKEAGALLDTVELILTDSLSNKRSIATWHLRKANFYGLNNEMEKAAYHFHQALMFGQTANPSLASEIYLQLGQLELKIGDKGKALSSFKSSYSILMANMPANSPQLCTALNTLGETYLQLGIIDSAIYFLQRAVNVNVSERQGGNSKGLEAVYPFELISSSYFLSLGYHHLYAKSRNFADLEKSAEFIDLGLRAIDSRRKSLSMTNDQLTFDNRVAAFFERAMETYHEMQRQKPSTDRMAKLFYISELSKSQSLGQSLRESNLRSFSNVSTTLRREEEMLRNAIQTIDLQSIKELKYGADANPDLLKEYNQELRQATERYQHLQDSIRQNLPGYYQFKYNKTLVTVADIQRDILARKPQAALLQFIVCDSSVYCQVITKNEEQIYAVQNAAEVKSRILALRTQIKMGMNTEFYENAGWLYNKLLRMSESLVRSAKFPIRELIIIPDQILCYLPFETLIRDRKDHRFIIADYDISYAYSSTLLWQKYMEKAVGDRAHSFIGLAPEFAASEGPRLRNTRDESKGGASRFQFQPLTGNRTEVDAISSGMERKKIKSNVLEGTNATEDSFRKLNLKQYDYVHFATHGFVDMDNPQFSGVAFSRNADSPAYDDILFTNEIYEMQFNAQLVCLSSCDSGIGKIYRGEGMIGLAQAFLFAGARNLSVSLWKVDDLATQDLMIDFYSRLPGKSLCSALSGAKRKMSLSKKYSNPYYWSSFILIGL